MPLQMTVMLMPRVLMIQKDTKASVASKLTSDKEEQNNKDFIEYRTKICDATLITKSKYQLYVFKGKHLITSNGCHVNFSELPKWLKNEEHLIEIFCLLAERNATYDFIELYKLIAVGVWDDMRTDTSTSAHFLFNLRRQNDDFFNKCGQFLLMAAITPKFPKADVVRFLINERNISPNFDWQEEWLTTPLNMLIRFSGLFDVNREPRETIDLLILFHKKGCNFNPIIAPFNLPRLLHEAPLIVAASSLGSFYDPVRNITYQNGLHPLSLIAIIALGANLFRHVEFLSDDGGRILINPLAMAYRSCSPDGIEVLLFFGAGLLKKELRVDKSVNILPQSDGYYLHKKLTDSEIIFFDSIQNRWIYTAKELYEMLSSIKEFDNSETATRLDFIARFLNDPTNSPDILVDGLEAVFKKRYESRRQYIKEYYDTLTNNDSSGRSRLLLPVILRLISEYLNSDAKLVDEVMNIPNSIHNQTETVVQITHAYKTAMEAQIEKAADPNQAYLFSRYKWL